MINIGFIGTGNNNNNINKGAMKSKLKEILNWGVFIPSGTENFNFIINNRESLGEIVDSLREDLKVNHSIRLTKVGNMNIDGTIIRESDILVMYKHDKDRLKEELKHHNRDKIVVFIEPTTYKFNTIQVKEI